MFNIGTQELLLILLVVLLLFGSKRIPEAARSFGKGMRQFQDAVQGIEREIRDETLGPMTEDRRWKRDLPPSQAVVRPEASVRRGELTSTASEPAREVQEEKDPGVAPRA